MIDLVKIVSVFVLIIVLLRFHWNLGLVLILASFVVGLLFGLPLENLILDVLGAAVEPLTLRLVAIVLLITFLGEILRSTMRLEGMVRSLSDIFVDRRWLLALMPMFIGMLPMVGGAMFSAPMVAEASQGLGIGRNRQTFLNYWFRHSWESVMPLYPALVLAAGLIGVSVQTLAVSHIPLFVATLVGGILFGMLGIGQPVSAGGERPARKDSVVLLLKSVWPILLVLVMSIVLGADLILSLLVTVVVLIIAHRFRPRQVLSFVRMMPLETVPIIVGALVFRRILETSNAVESVSQALGGTGIPLGFIIFGVPMVAGLLTGLAAPAFAIGLPIVLPLCGPDPVATGCALLAYAGGLTGILLSPLHLCLALTVAYFEATWGGVYRRMVPAVLLLVGVAVAVALLR